MEALPSVNPASRNQTRCELEGVYVAEIISNIVEHCQNKYAGLLLSHQKEIGPEDADRVERFLLEVFPPDDQNRRTHAHLHLTGEFAARIAQKLGYNSNEFRILGLLHDIGRLLTHPTGDVNPHRFYRNDLLGDVLLQKLNVPQKLHAKLQPNASYLHPEKYSKIEDFTPEQRVVIIADICGKRKADGSVQTFADTLEYHYASRTKFGAMQDGPWPSQNAAQRTLTPEIVDQWGKLYCAISHWLQNDFGVDIESIRKEIEADENKMHV